MSESPLEPTQEPVEGISDARRSTSAKQAFPVAWEAARSWREDARWYGIVPYTSIERAFAIPLQDNNPSWFFRFAVPGDDLEYLVEVNNGVIVGTNETRLPTYIEPALSDLDPLNESWEVNDNGVLLEQYAEQEGNLLADFPNMVFAYRLTKPKDDGFAIWALYNAQNIAEPIFRMNALTGEALPASE